MKYRNMIRNCYVLAVMFLLSSCNRTDNDFSYLQYQIENKLTSPIQVRLVSKEYPTRTVEVSINSNEIKDVINGESGLEGIGLVSYDSAYLVVNATEYKYIKGQSNGLLSPSVYEDNGSFVKNGKDLYVYKLTIDEAFLLNSME